MNAEKKTIRQRRPNHYNIRSWEGVRIIGPVMHHSFQRGKTTNELKKKIMT